MSKSQRKIREEKKDAFVPLVYICAPFRGDIEGNTKRALQLAELAYKKNCVPITPHVLFPFMDDNNREDREKALYADKLLLGKCQEVWVLLSNISEGMRKEIDFANYIYKIVRYFDENLVEVENNENRIWK